MEQKSNISVILPVHELNEITKTLFSNAVQSVIEQSVRPDELVIVVPKGSLASSYVQAYNYGDYKDNVKVVENDGGTDYASQVNYGVSQCSSEWLSLLEYDDEYAKIWFKNVVTYRDAHPNVDLFMPIIVDVDGAGAFQGFSNEPVWAQSFSDELGVLDNNALLAYPSFNTAGMVIRKSTYEEFGGFKPSIKLTFMYEFLLRMTFKDVRVMVIPRFGYKHVNQRAGSLFSIYKDTIDANESKWWLSTAKKEYYFTNDRKITYEVHNG